MQEDLGISKCKESKKKRDGGWGAEFSVQRGDAFFSLFFTRLGRKNENSKKGSALRRLGGVGNEIFF